MPDQPRHQTETAVRERTKVKEPQQYQVVMHNDDFTTMEFVVDVLKAVFDTPQSVALALMLAIHHTGKAVVGTYSYDIAQSKAGKAMSMAREQGFPLLCTCVPV